MDNLNLDEKAHLESIKQERIRPAGLDYCLKLVDELIISNRLKDQERKIERKKKFNEAFIDDLEKANQEFINNA